jgi:hypothetical protein
VGDVEENVELSLGAIDAWNRCDVNGLKRRPERLERMAEDAGT